MKNLLFLSFSLIMISILSSCSRQSAKSIEKSKQTISENTSNSGPPCIIYKTKSNFEKLVPVTLNDEKTKILSYPAITDIYYKGKFAYPTKLSDGFLLDNRGIDKNVAFLKLTYEEYSKLKKTPTTEELKRMIISDDPLKEMYNCGSKFKFKNLVEDVDNLIKNNELNKCRKIVH